MDVSGALAELTKVSAEIERAVVFDASGEPLGSTHGDDAGARQLAEAAGRALTAASELHAHEATRVEVELAEGGFFVLRDGGRAIAATTGPGATAGLVVYDLRTCLQQIDQPKPKRSRAKAKAKDASGKDEGA